MDKKQLDKFRIALGEVCGAASLYAFGERAISAKEADEIEGYVKTCYEFLKGMEATSNPVGLCGIRFHSDDCDCGGAGGDR